MKKNKIILALFVGMTLAACNNVASNSDSVSSPDSVISESTSLTPSTPDSTPVESTSVAPSVPVSTSVSVEPVKNYYDVVVENGTGSQTHVLEGTVVTVVANDPDTGYEFDCWKNENDEVVSNESSFTFEVTKNVSLTANFKKLKFNLVVTGGTGSGEYEYGDEVTVEASIESGFGFVRWTNENGEEISTLNPYVFEIKSNVTLLAVTELLFNEPDSLEAFKPLLSKSALVQNKTTNLVYAFEDYKYSSSYTTKTCNEEVTLYDGAIVVDGTENPYGYASSNYGYTKIAKIQDSKLKEVKKYVDSSQSSKSYAKTYTLVDEIVDSSSQYLSSEAQAYVNSYNAVSKVAAIINDSTIIGIEDEFVFEKTNGNQFRVVVKGHQQDSTLYHTTEIEVVMDKDFFIASFSLKRYCYVIATQFENGTLKPNAVARGNYLESISATRTDEAKNEIPSELADMSAYFISDFNIKGRYYENNVQRYFDANNPVIWKTAEINASYIEMETSSIVPNTYLESKTLTLVSLSDENIFKINKDSDGKPTSLKALNVGVALLTVSTSSGVTKQIQLEVKDQLPPVSLTIDCEDKVLINEMIELSIKEVKPISADPRVQWTVSDSTSAIIVEQDGKTYLKGLKAGATVNVIATSVADENVSATKSIFVSAGALSNEQLADVIVGKWLGNNTNEAKAFVIEFNSDGTVTIVDNYRAGNKITSTGCWAITENLDGSMSHTGTYVKDGTSEYKVIEITDIEMGEGTNIAMYLDIHFVIAADGSKVLMHYAAGSSSASHIEVELKKQ